MQGFPLFAARKRSILLRLVVLVLPVVFLVTLLSQTVLAQNTFVITDGDAVIVHTSYTEDPAQALDEAGIEVDHDEYSAIQNEDGVYDITVQRNDAVTVNYCGQITRVKIELQDDTVGDLLSRMNIPTGEGYEISQELSSMPVDGMRIAIDHHVVNQETYTLDIPFEITTVPDPAMPLGQERIVTEGIVGQVLCTADVEYLNAQEISRKVTDKDVLRETQPQVVAVGTGEAVGQQSAYPLIGEDVIVLPSGEVLTYYKTDTFLATAYTQYDEGCNNTTATMTPVRWGVVAVDPKVVPYGTRMFIVNSDGSFVYGIGTAEDCGGGIKGKRLDLYMPTLREAFRYGYKDVTVYFLGDANWRF